MAEKKEYKNSIRSRRMIRKAFLELIREKELEKVTVTEIVKRADLNRSTFYAHYPDIRGVVDELQEEIFARIFALFEGPDFFDLLHNPAPALTGFSEILAEYMDVFKRLEHTDTLHVRLDDFRRALVERVYSNEKIPDEIRRDHSFGIRISFFVGGIMNTYQQWGQGYLDCSLKEITEDMARLIRASTEEYFKEQ